MTQICHCGKCAPCNRPFPIQETLSSSAWGRQPSSVIPWWLAEVAYETYSQLFGTSQSLERLAERGGFGRRELIDLLRGQFPAREAIQAIEAENERLRKLQPEPQAVPAYIPKS